MLPLEIHMNGPLYSEVVDSSPSEDATSQSNGGAGDRAAKIGGDGERIISSVALFTTKSMKELEGLTFELRGLKEFLKTETERVQSDIDNALAGLKISPWR